MQFHNDRSRARTRLRDKEDYMRSPTLPGPLDGPFEGNTSSPPWRGPHDPLECRGCGSSLVGRRVGVKRETSRGIATVVETFECRCSKRRHIEREVAAR
jgi:hypothetical protein